MTTYNGEKYLRDQMDSILAQTVSDWNLIVCDDCSSDSTWVMLQEYEKNDDRVKIYRNEKNIGFVRNFEKAISLCEGDYIALSDQDDIWEKEHLEILLHNLKDAAGVAGNANVLDAVGSATGDFISGRERYYVDGNDEDKLFRILFYGNPFQGASSLFKREMFKNALPIPNGIEYHDVWFNAFACCLNGFNFTSQAVNNYRIHGMNVSGNHRVTFIEQIKTTFRRNGWQTDRVVVCSELLLRIANMSEEKRKIVLLAKNFHENRIKGRRIRTIATILKYYKKIYSTNNYRHAFARCIGVLLRG